MPIEAIVPRRLYRQVADQLRQLFDSGEYAAGDRLPTERELAERMGISRPTIREALIALEVEGRVRIRVGSGIYVTEPPRSAPPPSAGEGPFELLRAREFIEGAIAEEAAQHVKAEHIRILDRVLGRMDRQRHPTRTTISLDREFHKGVAAILGNAVLVRVVGDLFDQRMNPYFERLSSYFEDRTTWQAALEEHRAVRDALAAHDPGGAKAAMRHHLRLSQERFSRNFGEGAAVAETAGKKEPPIFHTG
ncbi:FadR/GntR family transcriptional regulator [Mesorhizobium sp.]|uniref:FadR/GntR family transcriptional regulator n=1 Tax=Mesorhizobium sp. TaxID=1871066 RepID=UPI000FE59A27|nr:FadR/GntR family transcriptional regulator [Mesorhizobium sp.]RWA84477.1 MAG: FadR family transcriptional regulator [Mesorhizobium sp.]